MIYMPIARKVKITQSKIEMELVSVCSLPDHVQNTSSTISHSPNGVNLRVNLVKSHHNQKRLSRYFDHDKPKHQWRGIKLLFCWNSNISGRFRLQSLWPFDLHDLRVQARSPCWDLSYKKKPVENWKFLRLFCAEVTCQAKCAKVGWLSPFSFAMLILLFPFWSQNEASGHHRRHLQNLWKRCQSRCQSQVTICAPFAYDRCFKIAFGRVDRQNRSP